MFDGDNEEKSFLSRVLAICSFGIKAGSFPMIGEALIGFLSWNYLFLAAPIRIMSFLLMAKYLDQVKKNIDYQVMIAEQEAKRIEESKI